MAKLVEPHFLYTIRGTTYVEPPYSEKCFPQYPTNCSNPGIDVMYIARVLNNVGINLTFILADEDSTARTFLLNGTADILVQSEATEGSEFSNVTGLSPSFPVSSERAAFYVKSGGRGGTETKNISRVFTWQVWVTCFASFVVMTFLKFVSQGLQARGNQKNPNYGTYTRLLSSGNLPEYLFYSVLSILLNVYANVLAIGFASQNPLIDAPFYDLPGLADRWYNGECKVMTYYEKLQEMEMVFPRGNHLSPVEKKLVAARIRYPPIIVAEDDYKIFLSWIVHNKSCLVHIDYESRQGFFEAEFGSSIGAIVDTSTAQKSYVYYYRSDVDPTLVSLITTAFAAGSSADNYNREIRRMVRLGLTFGEDTNRPTRPIITARVNPMALSQLDLPFVVLLGGLSAGIVLFFAEEGLWKCYHWFMSTEIRAIAMTTT